MSAFVDTSALYAALVASENSHRDALSAFRELLAEGRTLWVTSYVLLESIALLQHRIGLAPVRDLDRHIVPLLSVEPVTRELHRAGIERLIKADRRHLSLVDCVSFEFMRGRGLSDAFTLDRHFAEAGFRLIPPYSRSASRRPS